MKQLQPLMRDLLGKYAELIKSGHAIAGHKITRPSKVGTRRITRYRHRKRKNSKKKNATSFPELNLSDHESDNFDNDTEDEYDQTDINDILLYQTINIDDFSFDKEKATDYEDILVENLLEDDRNENEQKEEEISGAALVRAQFKDIIESSLDISVLEKLRVDKKYHDVRIYVLENVRNIAIEIHNYDNKKSLYNFITFLSMVFSTMYNIIDYKFSNFYEDTIENTIKIIHETIFIEECNQHYYDIAYRLICSSNFAAINNEEEKDNPIEAAYNEEEEDDEQDILIKYGISKDFRFETVVNIRAKSNYQDLRLYLFQNYKALSEYEYEICCTKSDEVYYWTGSLQMCYKYIYVLIDKSISKLNELIRESVSIIYEINYLETIPPEMMVIGEDFVKKSGYIIFED